jgi:hypothetical protein
MDEPFCNQARAYGVGAASGGEVSAVILYQQLKEAIERVEMTATDDEFLRPLWYDPSGKPIVIEYIGYYNQLFIVLGGRDDDGSECTALVPVHAAQLILKKVKKQLRIEGRSVRFIGHSIVPEQSADA